jgi:hypothetical protein
VSLAFHVRREVAVLAGLLIASIIPFTKGRALPPELRTDQTAYSAVRAEGSNLSKGIRNPVKDSEKYFAAAPQSNTAQDGKVAAAPRPVATEQTATNSPKVTYHDGQLTILAENSLLSDILSALHTAMGAEIDLPASASSERIWVQLGPGPARKVLGELLSGTDLNFVIQGSVTDADGIQSVMLTPHSPAGPGNPGTSSEPQERMANRQPAGGNSALAEAAQQENPAPTETTMASSDATPPTPPDAGSPRVAPQSEAASFSSAVAESVAHPSPPSSMTSDEIRQQLLSMYQQRKQLQPNLPSTPANPHP